MQFHRAEIVVITLALGLAGGFTSFAMRSSPVVLVGTPMAYDPARKETAPLVVTITYTAVGRIGTRGAPVTLTEEVPFRIEIPGDSIEGTGACPSPNVDIGVELNTSGQTRTTSSHGPDGATFSFTGGTNRLPLWMTLAGNAFCVLLVAVFIVFGRFLRRRRAALQP